MSGRLFSYKITNDTGFAPNPFFGNLTLATCKPKMRDTKRPGDWVAGFTSKRLCGDGVGSERLIFLARVTGRLRYEEYFDHPDFQEKIPDLSRSKCVFKAGDNIYQPDGQGGYRQLDNSNHTEKHKSHDLKSEWVLISEEFYYFGKSALEIPDEVRPQVPRHQHPYGFRTSSPRKERFLNFVRSQVDPGIHDRPHQWCDNDSSWKSA